MLHRSSPPFSPATLLSTATCADLFDGVYPEPFDYAQGKLRRWAQDQLRRSMVGVSQREDR